jgi:hypothetical protein
MTDQEEEILNWLLAAEEYLKDNVKLVECHINDGKYLLTRPTILLFGYFLENILKACIIKIQNLQESKNFKHLKRQLFEEAGYTNFNKSELDQIEFLSEVIIWGKYPKRGLNDIGEKIQSHTSNLIKTYSNQTVIFNDPINFKNLNIFSIKIVEHVSKSIFLGLEKENEIYFHETIGRIFNLLNANLSNLKKFEIPS